MNWEIKKFSELSVEELYEIIELRNEVFVVEQTCIYQDCDGKDQASYHLFGKENEDLIAYLRILPKNISYSEASIGRVITAKSFRKKGIGKSLMLKAIDFMENELGEEFILISAQKYAIDFYKSVGFKVVSEEYLEDDIPHVKMLYKASEKE